MSPNFFIDQLDYIFFFYGASFFVLGAVCFAILRRSGVSRGLVWWWLGLFGFAHGLNEWLDMVALSLGDNATFKVIRLIVLIISFVFLMEFFRRSAFEVWKKQVGSGSYIVLFVIVFLGAWWDWSGINAMSRYCLGLISACGSGLVLLSFKGDKERPLARVSLVFLKIAGIAMFLYGLTTGLVVSKANFFPANIINTDTFIGLFGAPVQFFRGIFAFIIATSIAVFAIKQSMLAFVREEPVREKRFLFYCIAAVISVLFLLYAGWGITDNYGRKTEIHEKNTRYLKARIYAQFIRMMVTRLETVQALAGSPELVAALEGTPDENSMSVVNEHLDRYKLAIKVDVCYLMDKSGLTIASSNRNSPVSFVGKNYSFRPYFQQAMKGGNGIYLAKGVTSKERGIYVSSPVLSQETGKVHSILGVTVAKATLDELGEYFRSYPYVFLVSPEGIIFVSSQPDWVFRSIRNISTREKAALRASKQFGDGPWDSVGFEKRDDRSGTIFLKNKLFHFVTEKIDGLPGWKIFFMDDTSAVAATRLMMIMIFLSFFLLFAIVALFIFRIFLDSLHISASEALYEALVEGSPDTIQLFNSEGTCISVNKNGLEMLEMKKEEILGRLFEELWPQEYKETIRHALREVFDGRQQTFETKMTRKDGAQVIKSVTVAPIYEMNGEIKYFVGIIRDITEERRARERVLQSSKMATVGALAAGVSHEFNNVLEIILGNAELAYASGDNELMRKTLKIIIDSARRAAWIIKTMLDFSAKGSEANEFVDLSELLKQNLILLKKVFESNNITVETHLNEAPRVYCNPGQLSQALVNIMMNAREAMRGLPEKRLIITLDYSVNTSEVIMCFKDSGLGIKEDMKSMLFGPFVTTKGILGGGEEKQPGVGLGLFVAYGIIKQHNGNISVESEEGKGAKFCVTLPIFSEEQRENEKGG